MRTGDFMGAVDSDMAAHQAIGEALVGTDKPFVSTGGTLMLAMAGITGRPGTEDDQSEGGPRIDAANYTVALGQRGVRSSVVRLAPMVHSDLDHHGFTHALIGFARENGVAAYTGDGCNRLAGGQHLRHRRALPPGAGEGPGRLDAARRG